MQDNYFKTILLKEDCLHVGAGWLKGQVVYGVTSELANDLIKSGSAEYTTGEEPHLKDIRKDKEQDKQEEE